MAVQESLFGSILPIYSSKMTDKITKIAKWKKNLHIPALIILQLIFIILFAIFVDYNPDSAKPILYMKKGHSTDEIQNHKSFATDNLGVYPSK